MKVVFDSNVYVSALLTPGGVADQAIRAATRHGLEVFISRPILEEMLEVLSRKFARSPGELARTALYVASLAHLVAPLRRVRVLADEPDNRVLECAAEAEAHAVVTGDRRMLLLGMWEGVELISLRQFVDRVERPGEVRQSISRYAIPKPRRRGKAVSSAV